MADDQIPISRAELRRFLALTEEIGLKWEESRAEDYLAWDRLRDLLWSEVLGIRNSAPGVTYEVHKYGGKIRIDERDWQYLPEPLPFPPLTGRNQTSAWREIDFSAERALERSLFHSRVDADQDYGLYSAESTTFYPGHTWSNAGPDPASFSLERLLSTIRECMAVPKSALGPSDGTNFYDWGYQRRFLNRVDPYKQHGFGYYTDDPPLGGLHGDPGDINATTEHREPAGE